MKRRNWNKHASARSELIAAAWLLKNGYEVFKNVSAHGIIDIVAIKDGTVLLLDVKTKNSRLSKEQAAAGVKFLIYDENDNCYIDWNPKAAFTTDKIICHGCGATFEPKHSRRAKYCSKQCRSSSFRQRKYVPLSDGLTAEDFD